MHFTTYIGALLEASGQYQKGGNLGHGRDLQRDERKLSKNEEIAIAEHSPIFRKYMSPTGWKFVATIHAAARAFQRRAEFEFAQWKAIHDTVAAKLDTFTRWKPKDNILLFFSRKYDQGYVTEVYPDTKTVRVITVLPKGKNLAPPGTGKVLVESFGEMELEVVEID